MKHFLTAILFFISSCGQVAISQSRIHSDHDLISSLVCLDKENPMGIEDFFRRRKSGNYGVESESYGFGYRMQRTEVDGDQIVITGTFYYFNDSIISYTIELQGPWKERLVKRYKKWCGNFFSYSGDEILPYRYRHEQVCRPLKEYVGSYSAQEIPKEIMEYMSPESGTVYGYSCGFLATETLPNRAEFDALEDSLTNDQLELLMFSINPVSRFTAFEYYLENRDSLESFAFYDKWLERNFIETPKIKSCIGDVVDMRNTKIFFQRYLNDHDK